MAAGAAPWAAEAPTRRALERAGGAEALRAAPGLAMVLRDAAWTVGSDVGGVTAQPAVVRGAPDAELILAQQAATLDGGALELGGTGTGPLPRALAPGLPALTPAGLALAASAELQAFTRAQSQQRVQASAQSMGVDPGTMEGVSAASWHAWAREQAWAGFAGVEPSGPTAQVAGDAVGLFELAHPGAVGRAVATGEGFAALRAFVAGALEAHAAGRLVPRPDALARGWAEVFPALDEAGRRLGELPGFLPPRLDEILAQEGFAPADPMDIGPQNTGAPPVTMPTEPLVTLSPDRDLIGSAVFQVPMRLLEVPNGATDTPGFRARVEKLEVEDGRRRPHEGLGAARFEAAGGSRLARPDPVDPAFDFRLEGRGQGAADARFDFKGPLPMIPGQESVLEGQVTGLIDSVVDEVNLKSGANRIVVDTHGLTYAQIDRVLDELDRRIDSDRLAPANRELIVVLDQTIRGG